MHTRSSRAFAHETRRRRRARSYNALCIVRCDAGNLCASMYTYRRTDARESPYSLAYTLGPRKQETPEREYIRAHLCQRVQIHARRSREQLYSLCRRARSGGVFLRARVVEPRAPSQSLCVYAYSLSHTRTHEPPTRLASAVSCPVLRRDDVTLSCTVNAE